MKKVLLFIAVIFFTAATFAQDEVTLTVIGIGENEEKATLQALRSAIEQTFGTFVSANTTILNDEIVQDEIVSVSTGNVKQYEKNATAILPNGHVSVSLTAIISINRLISYAKSKGSKAEFAGATYAANANLIRLKAESAMKAYSIMVDQLEQIAKEMFEFKLHICGEPQKMDDKYQLKCRVDIYPNVASTNFHELYYSTINKLELSEDEKRMCHNEEISVMTFSSYDTEERANQNRNIYFLPLSGSTYKRFQLRLANAIHSALNRYVIQEIGNHGEPIMRSEIIEKKIKRYTGRKRDHRDVYYHLDAIKKIMIGDFSPRVIGINKFEEAEMLSSLTLKSAEDRPLSRKERKDPKLMGKTHLRAYRNATPQIQHEFTLMIPVERMNTFQGFELTNVSPYDYSHYSYITLPKEYKHKTLRYY